jgi:hypothetical protein
LHVPHTRILTAAKSRIGELKEIHDKAEALRIYVRKAEKGLEKQHQYHDTHDRGPLLPARARAGRW